MISTIGNTKAPSPSHPPTTSVPLQRQHDLHIYEGERVSAQAPSRAPLQQLSPAICPAGKLIGELDSFPGGQNALRREYLSSTVFGRDTSLGSEPGVQVQHQKSRRFGLHRILGGKAAAFSKRCLLFLGMFSNVVNLLLLERSCLPRSSSCSVQFKQISGFQTSIVAIIMWMLQFCAAAHVFLCIIFPRIATMASSFFRGLGTNFFFNDWKLILHYLIYMIVVILSAAKREWAPMLQWYTLTEIMLRNDTARSLLRAVVSPAYQLLMTGYLLAIIIYFYSVYGFLHTADMYPDGVCDTLKDCFFTTLDYGLPILTVRVSGRDANLRSDLGHQLSVLSMERQQSGIGAIVYNQSHKEEDDQFPEQVL